MKISAFIFLFLAVLFTAQPSVHNQLMLAAVSGCTRMECCEAGRTNKKSDTKPGGKSDSNKCGNEGCCMCISPFSGTIDLVVETDYSLPEIVIQKEKTATADDNRLSKGLAESWHPPEQASPIC